MEPTIRKGEQRQDEDSQFDTGMIMDLEAQENPLPEVEHLQPDEETGSIPETQENPMPGEVNPQPEEESNSIPETQEIPPPEDFIPQPEQETGDNPETPEIPHPDVIDPQPVEETSYIPATQGPSRPEIVDTQPNEVTNYIFDAQEVEPAANPRKIALILSGGGARGAFQVGAEKYAREVKGYHWDIIAGVSVGAMNGAMLAMHRFTRLLEIWDDISDDQVYTGGFNLVSLVKLLFGAKSFYGNAPLQELMQQEFEAGRVIDDLRVGAVSLISGEYVQFTKESLELTRAILASASIPVVWPPVDVSQQHTSMVDGGVRNITPVGDVLDLEPDEIVVINCGPEQPPVAPQAAQNVLTIGMRSLDILQNEVFVNDMREFLRINALVREAEQQGAVLHHPKSGRPFKYYPCQVIEPEGELGSVLDFSQASVQAALKAGVRRAREVLGRP